MLALEIGLVGGYLSLDLFVSPVDKEFRSRGMETEIGFFYTPSMIRRLEWYGGGGYGGRLKDLATAIVELELTDQVSNPDRVKWFAEAGLQIRAQPPRFPLLVISAGIRRQRQHWSSVFELAWRPAK